LKILFLVPYTPNLIRTRPYNLIRQLAQRGHAVTLLTLVSNANEEADLATWRDEGIAVIAEPLSRGRSLANSLAALPTSDPLQAVYCWQPALARRLSELLTVGEEPSPFDVIHVEHLRGARYALLAKELVSGPWTAEHKPSPIVRRPSSIVHRPSSIDLRSLPIVWDSVDCISHLFRQAAAHSRSRFGRWVTRLELPRTEGYEGRLAWQFDAVLATSRIDMEALAQLAERKRPAYLPANARPPIHVLPNGVDLDYFQPDPAVERDKSTLVLSGKMSYHANITMAIHLIRDIMPLVWATRPEVCVQIVGKDPGPELIKLAKGESRINVTGTIPDVRPYMQRATLAVAPIAYGAGIQNKVLEAMACGTAVVASPQAVAALAAIPGRDIVVGHDSAEMAGHILRLLDNPHLLAAVAAAGLDYVRTHHRWDDIAGRLEDVYTFLLPAN
jgi:polysaccharide biosynthesis protein PslH